MYFHKGALYCLNLWMSVFSGQAQQTTMEGYKWLVDPPGLQSPKLQPPFLQQLGRLDFELLFQKLFAGQLRQTTLPCRRQAHISSTSQQSQIPVVPTGEHLILTYALDLWESVKYCVLMVAALPTCIYSACQIFRTEDLQPLYALSHL